METAESSDTGAMVAKSERDSNDEIINSNCNRKRGSVSTDMEPVSPSL